ncbi:tRNA (adenosine(37)-N6)-threonylcarbamoyltransferase complex dimerization subunit type 1 TsaB [Aquamicrobium segne]|uniref:N(6)-L-threonylcarbamoyladenine synthase n=1 Tax=Aquamicrobium segne TaxID=469547 RepID=A0ABW0GUG9_9HYPH
MIILAIDCSASLCAACVYHAHQDREAGIEMGREVRDLGKGHAEHLMAVIDAALEKAGKDFADLNRIAVSVGPGSFTGVRVGVSTARGLALALNIPAFGVNTLEALAAEAAKDFPEKEIFALLDGGRGEIHTALFDARHNLLFGPAAISPEEAVRLAVENNAVLAGAAAQNIADTAAAGLDVVLPKATADIATYARLATLKDAGEKPRPLYLREADAKPQAGFVLPRTGS